MPIYNKQKQYLILFSLIPLIALTGCGNAPFNQAIENGNRTLANMLLSVQPELIDARNEDDRIGLHLAVLGNKIDIVNILLDRHAEIDAKDRYGCTPLHYAARNGYENLVRILTEKGADLDIPNHYKQTPLHWAVLRGHGSVTDLLIQNGADVFAKDKNGDTPAKLAYEYGYRNISERLLPLHMSAKKGDVENLQHLLNAQPDLIDSRDGNGRTPLHRAIQHSQYNAAQYLIGKGAKSGLKDNYGYRPSDYAPEKMNQRTGINLLNESTADEIDITIYQMLGKYDAINIGLVVDENIVFTRAYGNGRLDGDYVWGSVSKPVTAMLIMHLVSTGLIESINDPIWKYSPRYQNAMPAQYAEDSIIIRQLLTHMSGVPHNNEPIWKNGKLNLKFKPGTQDQYSTPGYGVLGHIIEDVTGLSYSQAIKNIIGQPVGASSFWAEKHFRAPGARIHSTIRDMALFSIGVINHTYVPSDLFYGDMIQYHNGPTGLGWGIMHLNSDELTLVHGGSNGRPQAHLIIQPKKKRSICVLGQSKNPDRFEMDDLSFRLLSILETIKPDNIEKGRRFP